MEPSRGAFASRTGRGQNVVAMRGAQTKPGGEVFASRTARRRKVAATRGAPTEPSRGGVCITHGARTKLCSHERCAKQVQKGGVCRRHGTYSIAAAAQNGASQTPHPAGGYNARAFVASAITGGGGREIEIAHNLQADVSCAAAPRSPSLRPSIMVPNFSDDDKEIIGAWIWRSSCMAMRLGSVNNTNRAS